MSLTAYSQKVTIGVHELCNNTANKKAFRQYKQWEFNS